MLDWSMQIFKYGAYDENCPVIYETLFYYTIYVVIYLIRINFKILSAVGLELIASVPVELTIGNLVRRVLFMIREEFANKIK